MLRVKGPGFLPDTSGRYCIGKIFFVKTPVTQIENYTSTVNLHCV